MPSSDLGALSASRLNEASSAREVLGLLGCMHRQIRGSRGAGVEGALKRVEG